MYFRSMSVPIGLGLSIPDAIARWANSGPPIWQVESLDVGSQFPRAKMLEGTQHPILGAGFRAEIHLNLLICCTLTSCVLLRWRSKRNFWAESPAMRWLVQPWVVMRQGCSQKSLTCTYLRTGGNTNDINNKDGSTYLLQMLLLLNKDIIQQLQ